VAPGEEKQWKTREQTAFSELMERSGFKKAVDVAKFLGVSKSAVSRYLSCERDPPRTTLELFRKKLEERDRGGSSRDENPAEEYVLREHAEKLLEIREVNPAGFEAATAMIETLYRSTPKGKRAAGLRVSSKQVAAAAATSVDDAIAVAGLSPVSSPKREADEPNVRKRRRGSGAESE
jgi:predicted transcriptional regulator